MKRPPSPDAAERGVSGSAARAAAVGTVAEAAAEEAPGTEANREGV
jgi:hypothetical protein